MKILVTGGAGFIGSHVVDGFIEAGHDVVVVDNLSTGKQENINPKARFYELDIRDPDLKRIFEEEKPDFVDHHAAQISVPVSVKDPIIDGEINALGFLNLLNCCRDHEVKKVIFISSGGAIYGEAEEYPTSENYKPQPLSPYAIHKLIAEYYLAFYHHQYDLDYTILRYANVYGPRQIPHGEAGVVSIFITNLLNGIRSSLYAFPEEPDGMIRDYVFVKDIVLANLQALFKGSLDYINIGTRCETTTGKLYREISNLMGKTVEPIQAGARPGDIRRSCLNVAKAEKVLGWKSEVSLQEGLKKTIEFFINKT
ncbi:NAD-dependent epimerase/dehydratase family protein [Candidatus Cloacimonadota bacterium]